MNRLQQVYEDQRTDANAVAAAARDVSAMLRDEHARSQLDAHGLWGFVAKVMRRWIEFETQADPPTQRDARAHEADVARAVLGVARNAAAARAVAEQSLAHVEMLADVCDVCVVYERMSDPVLLPLVRVLAQLLANLVTSHEDVRQCLWTRFAVAEQGSPRPCAETVLRLLSSADESTSLAAHVFVLNSLVPATSHSLVHTQEGRRLVEVMLTAYDAAVMHDDHELIPVIVALCDRLLAHGYVGPLLLALGPSDDMHASQLTLVRVLVECVHMHMKEAASPPLFESCTHQVMHMVRDLSHATTALMQEGRHGVPSDAVPRLVRAHVGLLALLEAVHLIAMLAQETSSDASARLLHTMRSGDMADACITLLREAREFVPPKAPFAPARGDVPAHHAPSALHRAQPTDDRPGLPLLKRTALQVLATLAYHAPGTPWDGVHAFQDKVRDAGGLYEVLSLTMLDELNPYIREHAVFALRNLLDRNKASQAQVRELRPTEAQVPAPAPAPAPAQAPT